MTNIACCNTWEEYALAMGFPVVRDDNGFGWIEDVEQGIKAWFPHHHNVDCDEFDPTPVSTFVF